MILYNYKTVKEYGGFKIKDKVLIDHPPYGTQSRKITRITVWGDFVMIESSGEGGVLSAESTRYSHDNGTTCANLSQFI